MASVYMPLSRQKCSVWKPCSTLKCLQSHQWLLHHRNKEKGDLCMFWFLYDMKTLKDAIEMCIFHILMQKQLIRSHHYTSCKVFSYRQSASKLLRHFYPLESISSSVRKWPPPPHPQDNVVFFLFSTSLVDSGTTLIRVGEGGVSRKRTFWTSFLCKQWMCPYQCALLATVSTNFVADCLFQKTSFIPFIRAPIVHSVCQYDRMSERLFTGLKNCG